MHIRFQIPEEHQASFVEALLFDFATRRKNTKINREDSSSSSSCGKHCVPTLLFPLTCASSSGSSCSGWLLLLNKRLFFSLQWFTSWGTTCFSHLACRTGWITTSSESISQGQIHSFSLLYLELLSKLASYSSACKHRGNRWATSAMFSVLEIIPFPNLPNNLLLHSSDPKGQQSVWKSIPDLK